MRIAVCHVARNPSTGVWSVVRNLVQEQIQSGIYAQVAVGILADNAWGEKERSEWAGIGCRKFYQAVSRLSGRAAFLLLAIAPKPIGQWLCALEAETNADCLLLHLHNAWRAGALLPVVPKPGAAMRTVVTFHGVNTALQSSVLQRWLHRRMAKRLCRYADVFCSVDKQGILDAERILGLPARRFVYVPNGVPDLHVAGCPRLRGVEPLCVGFLGQLNSIKGWRLLADAVVCLKSGGIPIQMLIAGRGPDERDVLALAHRHPEIRFLGHVHNPAVEFFPRVDVLGLPSSNEGMPMCLLEALSCGIPILTTSVGGLPQVLQPERNGILVQRQVSSLCEALDRLYRDKAFHARLSNGARTTYLETFSAAQMMAAYARAYEVPMHGPAELLR